MLDRVINAQKARTFNLAVITDLHNNGGVSDANILHACQGVGYIADRVKLDAFACLGDHTDSSGSADWTECLADILACNNHKHKQVRHTDVLELIGNHDFVSRHSPKTYKTISAYSKDVVWGSMLGGYFYKDYSDYKLRIICLNTSETAWIGVSPEQYRWFIETLDLSAKEDVSEWQTLILSHVPLDWSGFTVFVYVLQAYINGTSWTDGTYSCDYTGKNQATIIACVHGHIHNLLVDKLYLGDSSTSTEQIDLYRIAIPEVTESYGNHYSAPFKQDVRYAKTNGTAEDTAFNVLCIDLDNKKIEAVCYGAGIDRTIEYTAFDDVGEDTSGYVNQIPLSVASDDSDFVGANGEDGYSVGWRINSSGEEVEQEGMCYTGFIPAEGSDVIRLKNVTVSGTKDAYIAMYTSDKSFKSVAAFGNVFTQDDNGVYVGTVPSSSTTTFVRFSLGTIDDTSIITVNQEITGTPTPEYINILDTIGYTDGSRCKTSSNALGTDNAAATAFGWYDCSALTKNDVIRICIPNGLPTASGNNAYAVHVDNAEGTAWTSNYFYLDNYDIFKTVFLSVEYADNILSLVGRNEAATRTKFRMSVEGNGADCIMTLNQEIDV